MISRSSKGSKVNLPVLESTQRYLASLKDLTKLAACFSLLGDPTRLKILLSLAHARELCVGDLADILDMETSAVSHQLRKLKDGGLIANRREGPNIYYQLESGAIREALVYARSLLLEVQEKRR